MQPLISNGKHGLVERATLNKFKTQTEFKLFKVSFFNLSQSASSSKIKKLKNQPLKKA